MTRADEEYARKQLNGYLKRNGKVLPATGYTGDLVEVTPTEAVAHLEKNDNNIVFGDAADRRFGYMRFWIKRKVKDKDEYPLKEKFVPSLSLLKDINRRFGHKIYSREGMPPGMQFRSISPEDARKFLSSRRSDAPEVFGDEGISPSTVHGDEPSDKPWYNRFFILKEVELKPVSSVPVGKSATSSSPLEERMLRRINNEYGDRIIPRKEFKPKDDFEFGGKGGKDRFQQYLDWSGSALTLRKAAERLASGQPVWGVKDESGMYVQFYEKAQMRPRVRKTVKRMRAIKIKKKKTSMLDRAMRMVWNG